MTSLRLILRLCALASTALIVSCNDPPVDTPEILVPAGNITGSVTYIGPPPCVQSVYSADDGGYHVHVVGAAIMLVFNEELLPPPDGLGTTARSLAVVAGDLLFDSVLGQLPTPADGQIACPPAGSPTVTVSAPFADGPLEAGRWQVRAFYDYDGDFSPVLKIHQLPTQGDVGGGALENATAAAQGAKPKYQTIQIGVDDGTGHLVVPPEGSLVTGVPVTLGLVLPFARPISFMQSVLDERPSVPASMLQTDPTHVVMNVDQVFSKSPTNAANAGTADAEFLRIIMQAGVPDAEVQKAISPPISIQADSPYDVFHVYPQTDATGTVLFVPETPASGSAPIHIANLFPEAIFGKLDASDSTNLTSQASPAVLINGLVTTAPLAQASSFKTPKVTNQITVNLRPSAICLDPTDPNGEIVLVTPSFTAADGETVIGMDESPKYPSANDLKSYLSNQFGRSTSLVKVVEGCLPPGSFSANLVYDTGQAWTLPNEAGVCQAPEEVPQALADGSPGCFYDGSQLAPRPLLPSQSGLLTVRGAADPSFCDKVAGTNRGDAPPGGYLHGVPVACLTVAEQQDPSALQAAVTK